MKKFMFKVYIIRYITYLTFPTFVVTCDYVINIACLIYMDIHGIFGKKNIRRDILNVMSNDRTPYSQ